MSPVSQKKALEVFAGTENAYKLAKKYKVKTAWGADILFDAGAASRQGSYLAMMVRWYTPAEALKMATADNGELMALSGFINPYPGKLGVAEEGALADLLLVDGNPLENIKLVADPGEKLSGHYEGRHHLQEYTVQVTSWCRGAECISSMGERYWYVARAQFAVIHPQGLQCARVGLTRGKSPADQSRSGSAE